MDPIRFQKILRRAFLIPVGLALISATILVVEVQVLMYRAKWVEHTDQVISLAQRIFRLQIDQETGLRAYLLTDDERFLQPFYEGRETGRKLESQLQALISDDPEQQERNAKAVQACMAWEAFVGESIARAKAGQDVADVKFQLHGKKLMDQYREARSEFVLREEQLRDERLATSNQTAQFVNVSVIALCLAVGSGLAVLGRKQLTTLSQAFQASLDRAEANAVDARAQKEWFHTTLRSVGDAVIATDANGAVTFMNPVAETLTGWTLPEATGKALTDVFRIVNEQTREAVENPVDKVRRLNNVVGLANHTKLISKSGEEFAIDDSGAPIRDGRGEITGIVLVFRDITHQRALEGALRSNERLAVAGRLSAAIAHEIHNPLDTVGNLLFLIGRHTDHQPELQPLIRTAQDQVYQVAQISKNMLRLHRESRNPSPVRITEVLDGVVSLIDETIAKGRRIFQLEHGFAGEIEGFAAELRQVFANLIKNAVEATSEGGCIKIGSVEAKEAGRNGVLVQVTDDGVGIAEQMQTTLFTPFASTKPDSGTGLGLWVSRSIVEKHGGAIRVGIRTDLQPGTTASVFLPLRYPSRMSPNDTAPTSEGRPGRLS